MKFRLFTFIIVAAMSAAEVSAQEMSGEIDAVTVAGWRRRTDPVQTKSYIDTTILRHKLTASLAEVLSENSSVFINSYGRGDLATASFRGTAPTHTSVYWNGIQINSPLLGMVDFSLIPMFAIDEVGLQYGLSSVQEGAGALGGSINLASAPDWSRKFALDVVQAYGSFTTSNSYAGVRVGNDKVQSATKLFWNYSKNDYPFVNTDIIEPDRPGYHPTWKNTHADYRGGGFIEELFWRPAERHNLSLVVWGMTNDRNLPRLTTYEGDAMNNLSSQRDRSLRMVAGYKYFNSKIDIDVILGADFETSDFEQQSRVASGYQNTIDSHGRSNRVSAKADINLKLFRRHTIGLSSSGGFTAVDTREAVKKVGFDKSRGEASQLVGLYSSWTPRLSTSVMARGGIVGDMTYISPIVGVEYAMLKNKALTVKAKVGQNQHLPTLSDLYYLPGGNPDLKSERGFSADLGLMYKLGSAEVELSVFKSWISDWILWLPSIHQYWTPVNIDRVGASGVEIRARNEWRIGERWRIFGSGTASVGKSINRGGTVGWSDAARGKQLPYIPQWTGNVFAKVSFDDIYIGYQFNAYGERFTTTSNDTQAIFGVLPTTCLSDFLVGYTWRMLGLEAKMYNAFGKEYRTVLRQPMPGRNYLITFIVKI